MQKYEGIKMGSKPLLIFIIFLNLGPSVLKELYVMSMYIHACGGVGGVYVSVCVCGMGDRQTDLSKSCPLLREH